jgi:hypothetical protein
MRLRALRCVGAFLLGAFDLLRSAANVSCYFVRFRGSYFLPIDDPRMHTNSSERNKRDNNGKPEGFRKESCAAASTLALPKTVWCKLIGYAILGGF